MEQIYYECINCLSGMKTFKYNDGTIAVHKVSFEAKIGEFAGVKMGQILDKKCHKCRKKTLIRL